MSGRAAGAPLAGVHAVTYDLWRTLVRDRDSHSSDALRRERLKSLLEADDAEVDQLLDDIRAFRHSEWSGQRAPTPTAMVSHALSVTGDPAPPELVEQVADCLGTATRDAGVEPLPGAVETLTALGVAGVAVALICDVGVTSSAVTRERVANLGLDVVPAVILSDEIGVPEPYRAPFAAALAALGAPAGATVHVGDLRRKDVAGAVTSGLRSIRYRGDHDDTNGGPEAEFVIDHHAELLLLLGL